MVNAAKQKGDQGERDVQNLLRDLLDIPEIRRALGAGRQDDVGDIDNVPHTALQVARTKASYLTRIMTKKVKDVEDQKRHKGALFAASFIRWDRGPGWFVVMSPEQWALLWQCAQRGIRHGEVNDVTIGQTSTTLGNRDG